MVLIYIIPIYNAFYQLILSGTSGCKNEESIQSPWMSHLAFHTEKLIMHITRENYNFWVGMVDVSERGCVVYVSVRARDVEQSCHHATDF